MSARLPWGFEPSDADVTKAKNRLIVFADTAFQGAPAAYVRVLAADNWALAAVEVALMTVAHGAAPSDAIREATAALRARRSFDPLRGVAS